MRQDIHMQARGRWTSILLSLNVPDNFLQNVHGPCPFDGGKDRFRFDDKDGSGSFFCSKCGAGSGLDFVMRFCGVDFKEAVKMIRDKLPGTQLVAPKNRANDVDTKKMLKRLWDESVPATKTDDTGLYLAGRHLAIPKGGKALRTHPGLEWRDAEGNVKGKYPCMLAAIRDNEGNPIAMHRTWIQDGKQAPVTQSKKSFGKLSPQCAIQLFPLKKELLAVAEGIETALAVMEIYGYSCWSVISASQMERYEWPKTVKNIAIFGDNDTSFTGQKSAYTLAYRAKAKGLNAVVRIPDLENADWADALKLQRSKTNTGEY